MFSNYIYGSFQQEKQTIKEGSCANTHYLANTCTSADCLRKRCITTFNESARCTLTWVKQTSILSEFEKSFSKLLYKSNHLYITIISNIEHLKST